MTSWLDSTQVVGAPTGRVAASEASMTSRSAAGVPGVLRNWKLKAWCSSSGRTYRASRSAAGRPGLGDADPLARRTRPGAGARRGRSRGRRPGRRTAAPRVPISFGLVAAADVGQAGGLDQAVGDVDAEAVDAQVEPEAQDRANSSRDRGVVPVEVGLLGGEEVQVPLAGPVGPGSRPGRRRPTPSRSAAVRRPRPCPGGSGSARARDPGPSASAALEPGVLVGGVVGTRSTMTRRPSPCASRIRASASARVPKSGSTAR